MYQTRASSRTLTLITVACLAAAGVFGSGTEYRPPPPRPTQPPVTTAPSKQNPAANWFAKGKQAIAAKDFAGAEKAFAEANRIQPNNPDTLNMLAYSQRKLGRFDDAFANYGKALKLRPRFPEAREYLGEAHIQAALREIETLKSYGADGKEELEDLVNALKSAATAQ